MQCIQKKKKKTERSKEESWIRCRVELWQWESISMTKSKFNIGESKLRLSIGRLNLCVAKESEVAQSCPTLWDLLDCSLPGSSIPGIFQARVLEWVAISFSRGSSQLRDWTWVSHIAGRHFIIWATREAWRNLQSSCRTLTQRSLKWWGIEWIQRKESGEQSKTSWRLAEKI